MSHSPDEASGDKRDYLDGWLAVFELLRQGKSWSGRERHCCFLNTGEGRFADVSAVTGLDFPEDGRGLAVTDWDLDGSLDLWVTNRTAPRVRFLRNSCSSDHHFVGVKLEGRTCNRDAIGARVELLLEDGDGATGRRLVRTLHAGDGYLAQSSKWVHFGLGSGAAVRGIRVAWPGVRDAGGAPLEEEFHGVQIDRRYLLVEGAGTAREWKPETAHGLPFARSGRPSSARAPSLVGRIVPAARLPFFPADYRAGDGTRHPIEADGPLLVHLWATWCPGCRRELAHLQASRDRLREAGLEMLALSVDEEKDHAGACAALDRLGWTSRSGFVGPEFLEPLRILREALLHQPPEMVVPTSLLLDREGRLAVLYRGPISMEDLLADVDALDAGGARVRDRAVPFPGRWDAPPGSADLLELADRLRRNGFPETASRYLARIHVAPSDGEEAVPGAARVRLARANENLGREQAKSGKHARAVESFRRALEIEPRIASVHDGLGASLKALGRVKDAERHFREAIALDPDRSSAHYNLATLLQGRGEMAEAARGFERAIELDPSNHRAYYNLGALLVTRKKLDEAVRCIRRAIEVKPDYFEARRSLGIVLHQQGRIGESIEAFEQALALEPGDAMAIYCLGLALVGAGDRTRAEEQLRLLTELRSDYARALRAALDQGPK